MNKSFENQDFIPFSQSPKQSTNAHHNWRGRNNRYSQSPNQSLNSSGDYRSSPGGHGGPHRRNKFNRFSNGRKNDNETGDDISRYCSHEMVCDPWEKLIEKFYKDEASAAKFDQEVTESETEESNNTLDTDLESNNTLDTSQLSVEEGNISS